MKEKIKAAAISYFKDKLEVPIVKAYGEDEFTKTILKKAEENGVKIVNNKEFFEFQKKIRVDTEIPPDVYEIVATILSEFASKL